MTQHRCSRCKDDVGEFGIRHKYASGLFCEPCLRELGVHGYGARSFWSGLWDAVVYAVKPITAIFKPKPARVERVRRVAYNVMKSKALNIPPDGQSMSPQKR